MSEKALPEILSSATEGAARDLASEIKRLKAQIASLEAELKQYQMAKTPLTTALGKQLANLQEASEKRFAKLQEDNASLAEAMADTTRRIQQRENELAQV